jgi:hypothetical protein
MASFAFGVPSGAPALTASSFVGMRFFEDPELAEAEASARRSAAAAAAASAAELAAVDTLRSILPSLLRRRAAKKVEALLEEQKDWFPVLDLYNAVLELQDQLRGERVPAGYKVWASKAGHCSAVSKALFIQQARKVILQRIGGGPMPGEATIAGVEEGWLRFWERSISEMSDEEFSDAFEEFQDERYYFRKSCRRGEMDDAGRRENLRMELWGVAARHEGSKRHAREFAAMRIARFLFPRVLRKCFLASELPKTTQELLELRDEIYQGLEEEYLPWASAICLRVVLAELRARGAERRAASVEVSVPVTVWRGISGTMGGIFNTTDAALRFAVHTSALGLGLCLNLRSGLLTCAKEMPLAEAQCLFFPREEERSEEIVSDYYVEEAN